MEEGYPSGSSTELVKKDEVAAGHESPCEQGRGNVQERGGLTPSLGSFSACSRGWAVSTTCIARERSCAKTVTRVHGFINQIKRCL